MNTDEILVAQEAKLEFLRAENRRLLMERYEETKKAARLQVEKQDAEAALEALRAQLSDAQAENKELQGALDRVSDVLHAQLSDALAARDRERYKLETLAEQYKELEKELGHENRLLRQALHNANEAEGYYAWMPGENNNLDTLAENVPVRISSTWLKELVSEAREQAEAALGEAVKALEFISFQPCENKKNAKMFGSCLQSNDCLTEFCLPCYAKAFLQSPVAKAAGERWRAMERVVEAAKEALHDCPHFVEHVELNEALAALEVKGDA